MVHGGKTTGNFLTLYMDEVKATNADLFIVVLGCNDVRYRNQSNTTVAKTAVEFSANMLNIINQLKQIGEVVVVNPWFTSVKDYAQDINRKQKEETYWAFDEALKITWDSIGVPYIQTTKEMISWYHSLNDTTQWLPDGVHPNNSIGVKVYADAVLFGNVKYSDYGIVKTKTNGRYCYMLKSLSKSKGADLFSRVYLKTLNIFPSPRTNYGSSNRSGFNNPAGLVQPYSSTYAYVNLEGDFPLYITFATDEPLEVLNYLADNVDKGIERYRLWTTENKEAIADIHHVRIGEYSLILMNKARSIAEFFIEVTRK